MPWYQNCFFAWRMLFLSFLIASVYGQALEMPLSELQPGTTIEVADALRVPANSGAPAYRGGQVSDEARGGTELEENQNPEQAVCVLRMTGDANVARVVPQGKVIQLAREGEIVSREANVEYGPPALVYTAILTTRDDPAIEEIRCEKSVTPPTVGDLVDAFGKRIRVRLIPSQVTS